jgi:hypothetical protein
LAEYQITPKKRLDLRPVSGPLERAQEDRVLGHLRLVHSGSARSRVPLPSGPAARGKARAWSSRVNRSGQACIRGWVESAPLAFWTQLHPRKYYTEDPTELPRPMVTDAWDVEGTVWLITDDNRDRGGDIVMELPARRYQDPEGATAAYADLWAEVTELALLRPLDARSWEPAESGRASVGLGPAQRRLHR